MTRPFRSSPFSGPFARNAALALWLLPGPLVAVTTAVDRDAGRALWFALVGALLVAVSVVDIRWRIVPNRLIYPALVFGLVTPILFGLNDAATAAGGGAIAFALMLVTAIVARGAMGMGDVKLAAFAGAVLGPGGLLPWLVWAFLPAALLAGVLVVTRKSRLRDSMPIAPFLAGATLAVMVLNGSSIGDL